MRVSPQGTDTFVLIARYPGSHHPVRRTLGEYDLMASPKRATKRDAGASYSSKALILPSSASVSVTLKCDGALTPLRQSPRRISPSSSAKDCDASTRSSATCDAIL